MSTLVMACVFFQNPTPLLVSLEDHDIFAAEGSFFYQIGQQTLVCDVKSGVLQMFDAEWQPTHRYDRTGPGPEELERPVILGVISDQILVVSRGKTVLVFDHNLRLISEMPPITRGGYFIRFGTHVTGKRFRVFPLPSPKHMVYDLELVGDSWEKMGVLVPNPESIISTHVSVHGGLAYIDETPSRQFMDMANFKNTDHYKIEVHKFGAQLERNLVQVLGHSTVGIEGHKGYVRMIGNSFGWKRGYKVHLVFIRPSDHHRITYLDSISESGNFLSRQAIDSNWVFRPIMGSKKILQVERENRHRF